MERAGVIQLLETLVCLINVGWHLSVTNREAVWDLLKSIRKMVIYPVFSFAEMAEMEQMFEELERLISSSPSSSSSSSSPVLSSLDSKPGPDNSLKLNVFINLKFLHVSGGAKHILSSGMCTTDKDFESSGNPYDVKNKSSLSDTSHLMDLIVKLPDAVRAVARLALEKSIRASAVQSNSPQDMLQTLYRWHARPRKIEFISYNDDTHMCYLHLVSTSDEPTTCCESCNRPFDLNVEDAFRTENYRWVCGDTDKHSSNTDRVVQIYRPAWSVLKVFKMGSKIRATLVRSNTEIIRNVDLDAKGAFAEMVDNEMISLTRIHDFFGCSFAGCESRWTTATALSSAHNTMCVFRSIAKIVNARSTISTC